MDNPVLAYLDALPEPKQATLRQLRADILAVVPDAVECMAYNMPAFRVRGKVVAGFCAFKAHLSYFPHSGSVLPALPELVQGYSYAQGTLRFAVDQPLPADLVAALVRERMRQAGIAT